MKLENVLLPETNTTRAYDVEYSNNIIRSVGTIRLAGTAGIEAADEKAKPPSIILPSLCHPHIHLDKAYLLTSNSCIHVPSSGGSGFLGTTSSNAQNNHPDYSDLVLENGSFNEALQKTSEAKTRYTVSDLVLRGSQLIAESIRHGVTSMRAFVEIDQVTQHKTIEAGIVLKHHFAHLCRIQLCAFAQDPIFSGEHGDDNRALMEQVLVKYRGTIDALGTTPYVEDTYETGLKNVEWAIETALAHDLHLDFHLDYNLDTQQKAMVFDVVDKLSRRWRRDTPAAGGTNKTIVFGHCTKMTTMTTTELARLAHTIHASNLPISFVGLPTSDLFMMGRPSGTGKGETMNRARGTLQILDLIQTHHLNACIGVNNVGNAFTPWGSADPLRLASLGVGLYHAGTAEHARLLYECVSRRARRAIGLDQPNGWKSSFGLLDAHHVDLLVIENEWGINLDFDPAEDMDVDAGHGVTRTDQQDPTPMSIPARQRVTLKDVVWDPPESRLRRIVR